MPGRYELGSAKRTAALALTSVAIGMAVAALYVSLRRDGRPAPPDRRASELERSQREQIEQLEALGYVNTVRSAPLSAGVVVNEKGSFPGVNLYTSMDAPEARLIGMAGRELHRWACSYEQAFPAAPRADLSSGQTGYFRGVHLCPDGDLLAIFEGLGMVRIAPGGSVRWAIHNRAHHDVDVTPDGTIYVLTRRAHLRPDVHPTEPVLEDFVDVLSPGGRRLDRISVLDAVRSSPFRELLTGSPVSGDLFHSNSVRVLSARAVRLLPSFAEGDLLISLRNRNAIVVIDPRTRRVVWATRDRTFRQHDATLLDTGRILVFDNRDEESGSRVIELEPVTQLVTWQFPGHAPIKLFSRTLGSAQRLGNGNTLVTFSHECEALEVTPDRRVVWRFVNPHRTEAGMAVTLVDVQRYPAEYVSSWLPRTD